MQKSKSGRLKMCLAFVLLNIFAYSFSQTLEIPQSSKVYKKWLKSFEKDASGLYWKYLIKGHGKTPKTGDYVLVRYVGKLSDNTLFNSSDNAGEPLGFNVNVGQVIKGWDKALLQSPEGSKLWLIVPSELGYGNQPVGVIPPNSTLYFELELLKVIPQEPIEPYDISGKEKISLPNGIQYAFVKKSEGMIPDTNYIAKVHFTGYLPDGTIFDTSLPSQTPEKFVVGASQIIAGINLAVQQMPQGSKARFLIPYQLAFGEKGYFNLIPPKSNVIFDIELLEVKAPPVIEPFIPNSDSVYIENGLYFYPIKITQGAKPKSGEIVYIHYNAYFEDGTLFDSSIQRDEPIMFMVGENHILPGLEMAVRYLTIGDKARVFVPYSLAYGVEGNPPAIPPKTNLIFDIELVNIIRR